MSSIGGRGFDATVSRYWKGDKEAFKRWLVRMGQWATDPFPENGAFKHPGPWPEPAPITCPECGQDRPNSAADCPECGAADHCPF